MNLLDQVKRGLLKNAAAPAFVFRNQIMTGAQFFALLCEVCRRLRDAGVVQGDVVGVSMDQSPLHCAVMLGLARLGAVSLPLHPGSSPAARGSLARRFLATKVICATSVPDPDGYVAIRLREISFRADDCDLDVVDYIPDAQTPARIALTSGTTSQPSGILYSHGYWLDRIAKTIDGIDARSRVIPVDLHLTLGNLFAFGALMAGGTVIFPATAAAADFAAAVNLHAATHILLPPGSVSALLPILPPTGVAFPTLTHLRIVGGVVPRPMLDLLRERFSPNVFIPYGISEIGAISMATPDILAECPESSGVPRPWAKVAIVDAAGRLLPVGQSGTIRAILDGMPSGYHLDDGKSASKFKDGWFLTGDIGYLDDEGRLHVEGREDDRINVGGRKFYPAVIEAALTRSPGVREAAVFSLQDAAGTTILAAAIVGDNDDALRGLPDFCGREGMGPLAPRRFFRVGTLPRNPAGKVVRSALPAMFTVTGPAVEASEGG